MPAGLSNQRRAQLAGTLTANPNAVLRTLKPSPRRSREQGTGCGECGWQVQLTGCGVKAQLSIQIDSADPRSKHGRRIG